MLQRHLWYNIDNLTRTEKDFGKFYIPWLLSPMGLFPLDLAKIYGANHVWKYERASLC